MVFKLLSAWNRDRPGVLGMYCLYGVLHAVKIEEKKTVQSQLHQACSLCESLVRRWMFDAATKQAR